MVRFEHLDSHPLPLDQEGIEDLQDSHGQFRPEVNGYLDVDEVHSKYTRVLAEYRDWRMFDIGIAGFESINYCWNHLGGYGLAIQDSEGYTTPELTNLLAVASDALDISEHGINGTLPFAEKHRKPIECGQKTATLRLGYPSISAGDELTLVGAETGEEWGTTTCQHTFTTAAKDARHLMGLLGAEHSIVYNDVPVHEVLQEYYEKEITPRTTVKGIVFDGF